MAYFYGLEFCHVHVSPYAGALFCDAADVPVPDRATLFFDADAPNGNVRVPWYQVYPGYYAHFKRSLSNNDRPPRRIYIQNQCTPAHGFEYVLVHNYGDSFVYETIHTFTRTKSQILNRMTQMLVLQLETATFPVERFDATTWGAPEIPMQMSLTYMSGEQACTVWPNLSDTGEIVRPYVLRALGKSRAWGIKLVNGRGEILDQQLVGQWASGPFGYLFAVPEHMMSDDRTAVEAYCFNPIVLPFSR
jgi:hypothetical protein